MPDKQKVSTINGRLYWGEKYSLPQTLDLLQIQKESYEWFIREGISESLKEISPVTDFTGKNWKLEFKEHRFGSPHLTPAQSVINDKSIDIP